MVVLHPRVSERRGRIALAAVGVAVATLLAACGTGSGASLVSPTSTTSGARASSFSAMNVSGLGRVLVDGDKRTVYVLTSASQKNVPCTSSNGCTNVWPTLPLASATSVPRAGSGIHAAMLSTTRLSDGKTYPTYNGWIMYEYAGDTGPGQANGQGITSFGGTWYVISPSGNLIETTPSGSSSGGGY
jgi:predicted lipoprotein with Yx(FWY)xxD motif